MAWWLYWGTLLEIDSLGYLKLQTTLFHPPLYTVFSWFVLRIWPMVDGVVIAQSLFFALSAAVFLKRWVSGERAKLGLALLLAVEPCSGKLACTVMTETVFLSLILLAFAAIPNLQSTEPKKAAISAIGIGMLLGLAYMTRYAAPVFLVAVVMWMLLSRFHLKRVALNTVLLLLGLELVLVPLRMYYIQNFGTMRLNGFSGVSLWNSAAYLYPDSPLRTSPENDFQAYLQAFPEKDFGIAETWHTNQIFHDSLPFQRYIHENALGTAATLQASTLAGNTAWKLLLTNPWRHFNAFVIPNVLRPFHKQDKIYADRLPALMQAGIWRQPHPVHDYWPWLWWIHFGFLCAATAIQLFFPKRRSAVAGLLIVSCWLYLIAISLLAVVFLRFVFIMGPFITLALAYPFLQPQEIDTRQQPTLR